ncbi:Efflux pump periplasmic linker BepF [Rhodobacteraceae bacterium THAF1]|uniref:efflux RND transporter periplasmic adaptor subunit n=1 Tax=Palleronia sp. THAF1 TaxID=2587842 RepID=UPI000F3BA63D|nr:HlyD family efflux transporter periplasmic adaptor subunit [Palleronia sp. THAF1]QFU10092.1 Efflux pump periplasmic linker BepF [Palleronia sp. THAF1]VDC17003.1 Efflux pump periplasmic linker BepF [Rhodobacteraceae bacterium THAF1]
MRFLSRALTGLFLLSLTIGGLAFAGLTLRDALQERAASEPGARPGREQVFAANIVTVTPQTIAPELASFGQIEARRALDLRAPVSGRIVQMPVDDGQAVSAGDLLFAIDPVDAERTLALAEADLADAEAELTDAESGAALAEEDVDAARAQAELRERAASRQRDLAERGIGTDAAVEEAELAASSARQQILSRRQALQQAQARVAQARTALTRSEIALDEAQRTLDDTRVTAAFDGTLSDLTVSEGGLVSANEQLAVLLDPDRLEIAFTLSTPEYVRLLEGGELATDSATVSLEVGGYTLSTPATITREAAAVGEGETGRRLYARLEEPQGFRPGDFARIRVTEPELDGVARLPAGAVDSADTVLVLGEDDRLELASVTRLRSQGDTVLVRAPDLEGREVVAERSPLLGPGIKVRPLRQADGSDTEPAPEDVVDLTPERRAQLIALVEGNNGMPDAAKARVLAALQKDQVPARIVERLEGARGG